MNADSKSTTSIEDIQKSYSTNLTVHGLSKVVTGKPIERIFWSLCLVVVMSVTVFLCRNFHLKYLTFDTNTEIIETQDNRHKPPTLVICANLYRELNCYNNRSLIGPSQSWCYSNALYQRPADPSRFHHIYVNSTNKNVRNCVMVNAKLVKINQEYISFLSASWNGILTVHIVPHELSENLLDLTYHSALPMYDMFQLSVIHIDKTIRKKRLPSPYESNCSFGAGIENFFSSSYDHQSCIQSCYMKEMYIKCNTVVDRWKPFMTAEMRKNNVERNTEETRACLANVLKQFFDNHFLNNCYCPLPCVEIDFEVSIDTEYTGVRQLRNYANTKSIHFGYRYHRLKIITEFPAYTIYDLLSDIAGIVGILMGMSSLSVLELMVLIFIIIVKRTKLMYR